MEYELWRFEGLAEGVLVSEFTGGEEQIIYTDVTALPDTDYVYRLTLKNATLPEAFGYVSPPSVAYTYSP